MPDMNMNFDTYVQHATCSFGLYIAAAVHAFATSPLRLRGSLRSDPWLSDKTVGYTSLPMIPTRSRCFSFVVRTHVVL